MSALTAETLIAAKKELRKFQKQLGRELTKGKFKDTVVITDLKKDIKAKKVEIGNITKNMIMQISEN